MGISTYSDLQENVYNWILRDSSTDIVITQDRVRTYIELCEAELSRELKVRELEREDDSLVTVASTSTVALPDQYRSMISLEMDGEPKPLEYVTEAMLTRLYPLNTVGRPKVYTIQGDFIRFAPVPDAAYGLYMRYFRRVPPLTDTNATNDILTKYPDAYLYGSIRQALMNIMDERRLSKVQPMYIDIVSRINVENSKSQAPSGSRMRPRNRIG